MARKRKIDKEMGFRLKKARTDQKLTYEELAEKSGVSPAISRKSKIMETCETLKSWGSSYEPSYFRRSVFLSDAPADNLTTSVCWSICHNVRA